MSIVPPRRRAGSFPKSLSLDALTELLPDAQVEAACGKVRHRWRNRVLPPGATVRSMVYRGLNPDHSISAALAEIAARLGPEVKTPTDSAWCQARSRLPQSVLTQLRQQQARYCRRRFGPAQRWHGREVFRIDGTTVSMPDLPPLVKAFGRPNTKHGRARFPVARITFMELSGVEVIWDYRMDKYIRDEDSQLHAMWHTLPAGCICLMDRKFCSFYNLAKLRQRGIHVVTPLHQRRDPQRLIRQGISCGKDQWMVYLDLDRQIRRRYNDPSLPKLLPVRLIRVRFRRGKRRHELWLVTTLMDQRHYPAKQVIEFYRRRWGIETRIGSLKTTLEMNILRGHRPNAVRREVAAIILGHNLVWRHIHQAAQQTHTSSQRISFAGAIKTILAFSPALRATAGQRRKQLEVKMLGHIARQTNHHPLDRVEPRLIKRETARFAYLRESRHRARLRCLS